MDDDVNLLTFLQKCLKSSGIITIWFPSPFTIFIPSLPISSKISFVAGSKSEGMSYVPNMIDLARDSLDRYLNLSQEVFSWSKRCVQEKNVFCIRVGSPAWRLPGWYIPWPHHSRPVAPSEHLDYADPSLFAWLDTHPLAFLPVALLLNCRDPFVLIFGLGID